MTAKYKVFDYDINQSKVMLSFTADTQVMRGINSARLPTRLLPFFSSVLCNCGAEVYILSDEVELRVRKEHATAPAIVISKFLGSDHGHVTAVLHFDPFNPRKGCNAPKIHSDVWPNGRGKQGARAKTTYSKRPKPTPHTYRHKSETVEIVEATFEVAPGIVKTKPKRRKARWGKQLRKAKRTG